MNHMQWAVLLEEERAFIKREMDRQGLTPSQLAGLANMNPYTVNRFLEGITYSPAHRTMVSMFDALGYEVAKLPKGTVMRGRKGKRKEK